MVSIDERSWRDQRGVALPMALLSLALLTTLMLALAAMSKTEPLIAGNQLRVSRAPPGGERSGARHLGPVGRQRTAGPSMPAGTLANPLPSSPADAPFDGSLSSPRWGHRRLHRHVTPRTP